MNRQPPRPPQMTRRQKTDAKHAQNAAYNASVNAGNPLPRPGSMPNRPPMGQAGPPPQLGQGQAQGPYQNAMGQHFGIPRPQFNPQEQMQQGQINPQLAQQIAQQYQPYQQDPNGYSNPQGGGGQGYSAQLQGGGFNPGGDPFAKAAQQNQMWRKTQAPAQPMGILGAFPQVRGDGTGNQRG